jgi:hypothetical protein
MSSWREKAASGVLAAKVAANVVTGQPESQVEQLAEAHQTQVETRAEQGTQAPPSSPNAGQQGPK